MTKMLPPCDHDECGLTRCEREAKPPFAEARGSAACPNCGETVKECACMRSKCVECGAPVGNITFTVCDECWDKEIERRKKWQPNTQLSN